MPNVTAPTATAVRAGIYVRISHDPDHNELGVQRQEKDCRAAARRRGWVVADVYKDDDLSAFTGKPRPAFQRLLDDVRGGSVTAVVAWHPDRLYRHPKDLEEFITVIEHAGCTVETVQAGDLNLATPSGRAVARTLGAWGRYESEHKSARLKAKHLQLAEAGADGGGGRPFGYEDDRRTIRPAEAALIREAADRVLQGEALRSVCRDWNGRGVKSVTGGMWSVKVFRGMLVSARISGRRERLTDADGKRHLIGPIVAPAQWPAIISAEQSDRLRARLSDPARRLTRGHPTRYLLTGGLAACGLCGPRVCPQDRCGRDEQHPIHHWGTALIARPKQNWRKGQPSTPSIVCTRGPEPQKAGVLVHGIRIASGPLDDLVTEAVLRAIDGGALAKALRGTGEDRAAVDQLVGVEQKLADLAEDWAGDAITRGEWDAARRALVARQKALRERVEASRRQVGLEGLPDPLRAAWPTLALHRRRAIIGALVEAVVIGRGVRGLNRFDSRRVAIKWKA